MRAKAPRGRLEADCGEIRSEFHVQSRPEPTGSTIRREEGISPRRPDEVSKFLGVDFRLCRGIISRAADGAGAEQLFKLLTHFLGEIVASGDVIV